MKIVLDTNVLISGILSPFGPPGEILHMIISQELQVCYDARILAEYWNVLLRPKFGLSKEYVDLFLKQIQSTGQIVSPTPLQQNLPDIQDEPFLEAAIAGKARCLITGNIKHFPAKACQSIQILSPTKFLDFYRKSLKE